MNQEPLLSYELWQEADGFSFFVEDNESARRLLVPNATLIWSCTASSWEEAQARKEQFLGWNRMG
jgi:hypothetical protein